MSRKLLVILLFLPLLPACLGEGNRITSVPDPEIWELVSAGCDAASSSPRWTGPSLRLSMGESVTARVSMATFPPVVCITEETVTYPSSTTIRFVDGAISCNTSSASDYYPWGDGADDVTFAYLKTGTYFILSKPAGDAGCDSTQTYNYVFQKW